MDYEFNVDSGASLDVHLTAGRLDIRGGEPGSIKVQVETRDPNFIVEQRGSQIYISSDRETRWTSASRNSAQVVIEVPEGTDANIATAAANVESTVRLGDVAFKVASGDIGLAGIGRGTVKTATGDISLGSVDDYVKVSSASGDISIGTCSGKAEFSAASGDIHIRDCSGSVNASSASGDIALSRFTGDRASFKSMSGDANIGVLPGTKLDLDATLLSGSLNLPEPSQEPVASERRMKIRAKIVSGDLTIRRLSG